MDPKFEEFGAYEDPSLSGNDLDAIIAVLDGKPLSMEGLEVAKRRRYLYRKDTLLYGFYLGKRRGRQELDAARRSFGVILEEITGGVDAHLPEEILVSELLNRITAYTIREKTRQCHDCDSFRKEQAVKSNLLSVGLEYLGRTDILRDIDIHRIAGVAHVSYKSTEII